MASIPNPGKYSRDIAFLKRAETKDGSGFVTGYNDEIVLACKAEVKTSSGYAMAAMGAGYASSLTRFTMRYSPVPAYEHVIRLYTDTGHKDYTPEYIIDVDEKHIELEIQGRGVEQFGDV